MPAENRRRTKKRKRVRGEAGNGKLLRNARSSCIITGKCDCATPYPGALLMTRHAATFTFLTLLLVTTSPTAAPSPPAEQGLFAALPARSIGPANMGGRIVDVEVVETNPKTIYLGVATGGIWKTTDGGDSWKPIFDEQPILCVGDIAVSQSNPDVVWVGTGENNPRNSVSWGD